jgi:putative spermidine/putrescine transport system substrate-binding protein
MRNKRLLQVAAVFGAAVLIVSGCSDSNDDASGVPGGEAYAGPVGDGEGALNVLAWPGYAEDGSTDPAVDWVTPFEEETGCEVEVKVFPTSNEAVKLFNSGDYDVVSASGDASLRLIFGDKIQPMNTELVPNYADIIEVLKNQPWNTVEGVNFGIPHGRGANLLLYTAADYPEPPESWADMWEADSPIKGKISPYDDAIYIADAAVYLKATQPDLGIENPYALDQEQFDAAIALLEQQKPLVAEYWADVVKQGQSIANGTVRQSQGWELTRRIAGDKVSTTKPAEGATGWSDTWMIKKDTENINCAYKWVNHVASPEVNAQIAEYFGEAPANKKSCELTKDANHCEVFHAEDEAYWEDVYYWTTPQTQCVDGRTDVECVGFDEWVAAWSKLRSS